MWPSTTPKHETFKKVNHTKWTGTAGEICEAESMGSLIYGKWQGTACFHKQISSAARLEVQLKLGGTKGTKCPSAPVENPQFQDIPCHNTSLYRTNLQLFNSE